MAICFLNSHVVQAHKLEKEEEERKKYKYVAVNNIWFLN